MVMEDGGIKSTVDINILFSIAGDTVAQKPAPPSEGRRVQLKCRMARPVQHVLVVRGDLQGVQSLSRSRPVSGQQQGARE